MKRAHDDSNNDISSDSYTSVASTRPAPVQIETGHATMPSRQRLAIARLVIDKLKLASIVKEPCSRFALLPADIIGIVFGSCLRGIATDPPADPFAEHVFGEPSLRRSSSNYGCDCFKLVSHNDACALSNPKFRGAEFCTSDCATVIEQHPSLSTGICQAPEPNLLLSGPDLIVIKGGFEAVCVIANIWTNYEVHCRYPVHKESRKALTTCIRYGKCTAERHEDGTIVFYTGSHAELITFVVNSDGQLVCSIDTEQPRLKLEMMICTLDKHWIQLINGLPSSADFITKEGVAYRVIRRANSICIDMVHAHWTDLAGHGGMIDDWHSFRAFNDMHGNVCVMIYMSAFFEYTCGTKFLWFRKDPRHTSLKFVLDSTSECDLPLVNSKTPVVIDQAVRLCTITVDRTLIAICPPRLYRQSCLLIKST